MKAAALVSYQHRRFATVAHCDADPVKWDSELQVLHHLQAVDLPQGDLAAAADRQCMARGNSDHTHHPIWIA
jgi:hypothetical protein